jgi:hypothetical protein
VMEQEATSAPRRTVPSRTILILKRARLNGVTENSFSRFTYLASMPSNAVSV